MKSVILMLFVCTVASAQTFVELRGTQTQYRYADAVYTFQNRAMVEAFYIGLPGENDLNLGTGYLIKADKINFTPAVYAVVYREGEVGVKIGITVNGEARGWKVNGFLAKHWSVKNFPSYSFADPFELTKAVKHYEIGLSTGFVHIDHKWNPLAGPVVKRNDKAGAWSLSIRGGSGSEIRLGRTFNF